MSHSLIVTTPPSPATKRQRSQDGREGISETNSAAQNRSSGGKNGSIDSRSVPVVKVPAYLNKSRSDISNLFQELEWKQRFRLSHAFNNEDSPFRVDRSLTVISRNRYGNVQPWDASRIKLKMPLGGSDYVNASPISLKSRSASPTIQSQTTPPDMPQQAGSATVSISESKYIATQGPKDGQFSHFWHMVMQETVGDIGVIIMLTTCYEGNKEKCGQYFPVNMTEPIIPLAVNEQGDDAISNIGDDPFTSADSDPMSTNADSDEADNEQDQPEGDGSEQSPDSVTLISLVQDPSTGCQVRHLHLEIGGQSKEIYHYLFNGWPDYGKPEAEDRKALLELAKQSAHRSMSSDNPRFVHCSAGVGRTGTFIALDHLLQELEKGSLATEVNEGAIKENAKTSTWGKSGPVKESTPEAKEDVIYDTVDKLREQRMMMVMNEVQFSFLYEVLKEAYMEKYQKRETGPLVLEVEKEPTPNWTKEGREVGDTDGEGSEAETEIIEREEEVAEDPYSAVAPESIRQGQERTL